ncbi:MAG: hypothetical protein U0168_02320 [Nannocystaceae bacterium]
MNLAFRSRALGDLHLSVWHRAADGDDVVRLREEIRALARSRPRVALMLVIPSGVGLSSEAARREAVELLRELRPALAAIALVIRGSGFASAAIRAMFTGLGLVLRLGVPWKMFAEVGDAMPWLSPLMRDEGAEMIPDELVGHVADALAGAAAPTSS